MDGSYSCAARRATPSPSLHVLAAYPSWVVDQGHRPFADETSSSTRSSLCSSGSSLATASSCSFRRSSSTSASPHAAGPASVSNYSTPSISNYPSSAATSSATAATSPSLSSRFRTHPRPLTRIEKAAAIAQQAVTGDDLAPDMYDNDGEGWHLGAKQQSRASLPRQGGGQSATRVVSTDLAAPARNPTPGLFDILSSSAGQLPTATDLGMAPTPSEPEKRFRGMCTGFPFGSCSGSFGLIYGFQRDRVCV